MPHRTTKRVSRSMSDAGDAGSSLGGGHHHLHFNTYTLDISPSTSSAGLLMESREWSEARGEGTGARVRRSGAGMQQSLQQMGSNGL
ncbi:MAG: hypothetical protein FRX49_06953 [Trebouxia sp. A1-2]|nr:MAG: hypothetical protein FRX49_06953 [Trebouxia sp. A1-2]